MSYRLLSAILKSSWFIHPEYVESHMPIIANILSKSDITASVPKDKNLIEDENAQPYALVGGKIVNVQGSLRRGIDYNSVPSGSVAVIPVKGVLMKDDEDDCGYFIAGTATLTKRLQEADNHPNISGIILNFDTPGGTIDGIQAFADSIKAAKKPVVGFIDGLCASAGVYGASSCDYIIANNITAEIGSIGVMMSFIDAQPYYEKLGFKFHEVYSSLSPDKNKGHQEAKKGNYELVIKEGLDPYAQIFRNQVKSNRPAVTEESMTGKLYIAEEALKRGLIDEIGNIEVAVKKIEELAGAKTAEASINKSKTEMKQQFVKLNAVLAVPSLESEDEGVYLNEEQLQKVEDSLTAKEAAEAELATTKEALTNAQNDLTAEQEKVADRDTTIAGLKKGPAANTAKVVKATDKNEESESADDLIDSCETGTMEGLEALKKQGLL